MWTSPVLRSDTISGQHTAMAPEKVRGCVSMRIRGKKLATVFVALGAILGSAALSACSGGSDSGDDVTLNVWGWRPEDVAGYKKIFAIYEKENPGVKVKYVPYKDSEYDTVLSTGISDENGPDVAQLRSYGSIQPLINAGNLVDLGPEIPALKDFPETTLDAARGVKDGKVYGVPFALQTMHVFYNKDVFEKLGLQEPTTWDEMFTIFKKVQEAGYVPLANTVTDVWMLPIEQEIFGATTYGGQEWVDQALKGEEKFSGSRWVSSIETWLKTKPYWGKNATSTSYTSAQALFTSGKAAMFPGGIFELNGFTTANKDLKIGIFNVPPAPGAVTDATLVPGFQDGSFGVSSKTKHPEEAKKLAAWMASKEFGQAFSDELKQISSVPGVVPQDELLAEAASLYEKNPSPYTFVSSFGFGDPGGWALGTKSYSEVILGKKTPQQAGDAIQHGIDQWFKP